MKTYFIGWDNIKWFCRELLKTFSNQKSFFSSKRIERFIFITTALVLLCLFCHKNWDKLTTEGILMLVTPLFVYAGYNMAMGKKDKVENTEPQTQQA